MNLSFKRSCMFLLAALTLIVSLIGVTPARAAGLVVDSLADGFAVDSNCTLREAIQNAKNDARTNADCSAGSGADIITFSVSGTIALGSVLYIYDSTGLTIDGAGTVTISGGNSVQVADVGGVLTLKNLTIANGNVIGGYGDGGGIRNEGSLTVTNTTFLNNSASYGDGGAIYNFIGGLAISNCTFTGNTAVTGGAVYNYDGTVTITNSTFSGNSAPNGLGGAIHNVYRSVTVTNSTFTGNSANWGNGGGIYNTAGLTITNSTFSDNTATGGLGGGVFTDGVIIRNSTFADNSAGTGGGIYHNGALSLIANSTFSGNSATAGGVNGGGFYNTNTVTISNSTFADNSVPGSGGGIGSAGGTVTLRNTILAYNIGGNCSGTITNGTSNLDSGTTCGWDGTNGSLSNKNPLLGTLTGSPAYYPLTAGSPAINAGDDPVCANYPVNKQSQNGLARPQGSHCDIGSFEKGHFTLSLTSIGTYDGWILESSETSIRGGTKNSTDTTFKLGDEVGDKQYRAILSFNTTGLPDTAVITKVTLKIRKMGQVGTDPFNILTGLKVDIRKPFFGTTAGLVISDFQALVSKAAVGTFGATPVSSWYSAIIGSTGYPYINKTGNTQFRLYFVKDDNDDGNADYMKFFSGNYATAAARPTLIIEYYVP